MRDAIRRDALGVEYCGNKLALDTQTDYTTKLHR